MNNDFTSFVKKMQLNFKNLEKDERALFKTDIEKNKLWDIYINSFPEGTNKVYRTNRQYDCNACKSFIKNIGGTVFIKNGKLKSIWDFDTGSNIFQPVVDKMSEYVESSKVCDVYISKTKRVGIDSNESQSKDSDYIIMFEHLFLDLPHKFCNVNKNERISEFGSKRNAFYNSLEKISTDSIQDVLYLVENNSIYRGLDFKKTLVKFFELKKEYDKLQSNKLKENFAWEYSTKVNDSVAKIKNSSIGKLLLDLTNGVCLDNALSQYESIVAPENYKRPKGIFTKKTLENAKKTIDDLGYTDSLRRRYANKEDVNINNILFIDKTLGTKNKNCDIFEEMLDDVIVDPNKFSRVEEMNINEFIENTLKTTNKISVLFENKHKNNMVSLTCPVDKNSENMFKWNNSFGWAYKNNVADSSLKRKVREMGGNVDGDLRFSIKWNDGHVNKDDLDAHCITPNGKEINYMDKRIIGDTGVLDVDIIDPIDLTPAVENISWEDKNKMHKGKYSFYVDVFSDRGGEGGFVAEIEFDGKIYTFNCDKQKSRTIEIANVFLKDGVFTIENLAELNKCQGATETVWGVKTFHFVPVSTMMFSPNYWNESGNIGNKHVFFMLDKCLNDERPNGFYNEFLNNSLLKHRKVFEALGDKLRIENSENQLSGVGFSLTKRDSLLVKIIGKSERLIRLKF